MVAKGMDHSEMVAQALNDGVYDEQSLTSAAILADRLDAVKRLGGLFESVSFSPAAKQLLETICQLAS